MDNALQQYLAGIDNTYQRYIDANKPIPFYGPGEGPTDDPPMGRAGYDAEGNPDPSQFTPAPIPTNPVLYPTLEQLGQANNPSLTPGQMEQVRGEWDNAKPELFPGANDQRESFKEQVAEYEANPEGFVAQGIPVPNAGTSALPEGHAGSPSDMLRGTTSPLEYQDGFLQQAEPLQAAYERGREQEERSKNRWEKFQQYADNASLQELMARQQQLGAFGKNWGAGQ